MVKVIMGLKGSGKTKKLVDLVAQAVENEQGDVICIEKDKKLTYDIPYRVRLIHASEYSFGSYDFFKGFISGLHAGNYDITHVFIDNFFKLLDDTDADKVSDFLGWLEAFSSKENVKFTISITADPEKTGDNIKKYF